MSDMIEIPFPEIARRLKQMSLPAVDRVVGIANGGVVPASLVAFQLERPLTIIHINFRAPDNSPQRDAPALLAAAAPLETPQRILLVDDVSVTGQTMNLARRLLLRHHVTTLVMKGTADYVVFPEVTSCVHWSWKQEGFPVLVER